MCAYYTHISNIAISLSLSLYIYIYIYTHVIVYECMYSFDRLNAVMVWTNNKTRAYTSSPSQHRRTADKMLVKCWLYSYGSCTSRTLFGWGYGIRDLTYLDMRFETLNSSGWGFEFLHACISWDNWWTYCGLTHDAMCLDVRFETLNLNICELNFWIWKLAVVFPWRTQTSAAALLFRGRAVRSFWE